MSDGEPDIAVPARALGDPVRGVIASALVGGRQVPAGELARTADVSPSTASEHLQVLLAAGLIAVERRGRNRFYRLADDDVARAVEALQAIAPRREVRSLAQSNVAAALRGGRTCYDHLAGDLGLRVTDLLRDAGVVGALRVGEAAGPPAPFPTGTVVEALGVLSPTGRRAWSRGCLDWTGRRPHVAGQVGAQVLQTMRARGWLAERGGSRAVSLTAEGERGLRALEAR